MSDATPASSEPSVASKAVVEHESPDLAPKERPSPNSNHGGDAQAPNDESPSRGHPLNANAKSFVPRLETASSSSPAKGRGNRNKNDGASPAKGQQQQQQQQQQHQQMPQMPPTGMMPPVVMPGMDPAMAAAFAAGGFGMPPMLPGFVNPMLSPMIMAALAASGRGMAPPPSPFASTPMAQSMSMPMGQQGSSVVNVNVGNASLQALRAHGPTKFACVLLVGMPRVGKTTIGRGLVSQLADDDLFWDFFSGGDYLRDTPTRPAPWDTTKDVYDALSAKIDELQARADTAKPIKGLIIDKQCRGTEELYYLTALLKKKGLALNGVVGLVADDDQKLMERLGETDQGFHEKCKFHRVIQTRIREASKAAGLWRPVDALDTKDAVVRKVRSMVLGCSSQAPHKQLTPSHYHEGLSTLVDDYATYAQVMGQLVQLTRMPKATQFPGFTSYTPLPAAMLNKKNAFKEYTVRRRSDGTKFVLVYDGASMYLVPRHMRCVFHLKSEAWLGIPLQMVSKFVLDGDLVRLSKDRSREKFLVQDLLCWIEKGSQTNLVSRASWKERQERIKVNVCGEASGFFSNGADIIVVHQQYVEVKDGHQLFEATDYATDGFVFHPLQKRDDPVYMWRPPESVTVDFRLGTGSTTGEGTKKFTLQVFDQKQAKFIEYGNDTVTVQENRQFVVEGALCVCSLKPDEAAKPDAREWSYVRTRTDIPTAAFKSYVDDLLANCMIPKAAINAFFGVDPNAPKPAPAVSTTPLGDGAPTNAAAAPAAQAPQQQQQRGGFGAALPDPTSMFGTAPLGVGPQHSAQLHYPGAPAVVSALEGVVPAQAIHTAERKPRMPPVREPRGPAPRPEGVHNGDREERKPRGPLVRKCSDANCGKIAEGEYDVGDKQFYCLECWSVFEKKPNARGANNNNTRGTRAPAGDRAPKPHNQERRGSKSKAAAGENENAEGGAAAEATEKKPRAPRQKKETDAAVADGADAEKKPARERGTRAPKAKTDSDKSSPVTAETKPQAAGAAAVPVAATA